MSDEYFDVEGWLDDDNEYECPSCNTSNAVEICACGGLEIKVQCNSCREMTLMFPTSNDDGTVSVAPPETWVSGEPTNITYCCPHCNTTTIHRKSYDDGLGYYDVKLTCESCGKNTWE